MTASAGREAQHGRALSTGGIWVFAPAVLGRAGPAIGKALMIARTDAVFQ